MAKPFEFPKDCLIKLVVYMKDERILYFYNFEKEQIKGVKYNVERMTMRLLNGKFKEKYNRAIFYNNLNGNELGRMEPGKFSYDAKRSHYRAVIYLKSEPQKALRLYSALEQDRVNPAYSLYHFKKRVFATFTDTLTVLIYDNKTNQQLEKYINGLIYKEVELC